jgi:CubicO group peptidase (beta-lactamase class C family)
MIPAVRVICFTLLSAAFSFCAAAGDLTNAVRVSVAPVFPGVNWERETNALSTETIREADAYVRTLDTTGLMVVQHGRVIYEYGDVARLSYLASARKSVLSMLYGRYVAAGEIRLDATLKDLKMSDVGGLLPIEERAKVIDLITARSGVYHRASNAGDLLSSAPKRGSQEPGTYWLYSNWDFNAAGAAFERMTGKNIYDALCDDIAIPIGMQDFDRERQQKQGDLTRSQYPAYHLVLSTRDMARLGLLMLRQGQWRDQQIIPADWVRRSTSALTPLAQMQPASSRAGPFGYGYMWWIWDGPFAAGPYRGAYTAMGSFGQDITILPAVDMVVAHKTWPTGSVNLKEYLRLLDLLTGKKPASPAELALWEDAPRHYDFCQGQYQVSRDATSGTNPAPQFVGIRRDGNRLLLNADLPARAVQINLTPKPEPDCFVGGGNPVTFYRDEHGEVTRFTARFDGTNDISFEKVSGQPPPAPALDKSRIPIKLDPRISDAYAGRYTAAADEKHPDSGVITFKWDGNALIGQRFAGEKPTRFAEAYFPESETNFFNTTEDEELTFLKNDQGTVTGVIWHQTGTFGEAGWREYKLEK